jgi:hypothetical protein
MATRYQRVEELLAAEVDEEVLLFDATRGTYFATGGVGALVWSELAGPRTLEELSARVHAVYDVTLEECTEDVREFLEAMHAAGIVHEA